MTPTHLDGAALSLAWGLPFVGLLLSIALGPQLAPRGWRRHFGKVAGAWTLALLVPLAAFAGPATTLGVVLEVLFDDYLPFAILIFALFTIAGGVLIQGRLGGTPAANTAVLGLGTLLAGVAGTTGAAMLLVRPLIAANRGRPRDAHVMVFFIFLVANAGGGLTPIGPPLFLGLLKGVGFGWAVAHLLAPFALCASLLLGAFYGLDRWFWRREGAAAPPAGPRRLRIAGRRNLVYLGLAVAAVAASGAWRPGVTLDLAGVRLELQNLVRDLTLLALALVSWTSTPARLRVENAFTWRPLAEVVWLFLGVFLTMAPVLAILKAGAQGALAPVVALATGPDGAPRDAAYFWVTGLLSSVLDNAPTYLIFLNVAGGDPVQLMGPLARTLTAISAGAVFFGGLTYIGNAPNFMVRAIASERGVRMPSFFGFIAWSTAVLLPILALTTWVFFR